MKVQVGNEPVSTLNGLNTAIEKLKNVGNPKGLKLQLSDFCGVGNPTAAEINQAIANSNQEIYEYVDLQEIIDAVNQELASIVADPAGFVMYTGDGHTIYLDDGNFALTDHQKSLLARAAHNDGAARHNSEKTTGFPANGCAYIHDYGSVTLYAFRDDLGSHRAHIKVVVLKAGTVNAGNHVFT